MAGKKRKPEIPENKRCGGTVPLKGIVFDFDGTIVSTHIDFAEIRRTIKNRAQDFRISLPSSDLPVLEMLESVERLNSNNNSVGTFIREMHDYLKFMELDGAEKALPLNGSLKLLRDLKKKGIKVGIITRNCREAVERVAKRFNIPFDILLTRDDVENVKPDCNHLRIASELMGLNKDEIVIAGDHAFDIRCGKNFGCLTCGIVSPWTDKSDFVNEGADFIFKSIEEIGFIFGIYGLKAGKLPNSLLEYLLKNYIFQGDSVLHGPGIGVDCAVFRTEKKILFAKTDPVTLVGEDVGTYLLSVNINDVAVGGGVPGWFMCDFIFPENSFFPEVEEVFRQVSAECGKRKIDWIGGHTEVSDSVKKIVACGFMLGVQGEKKQKNPGAPQKGDKVLLINEAGIEAASIIVRLKATELRRKIPEKVFLKLLNSTISPGICVYEEARFLWENFKIRGMHDPTEGGISTALYELSCRYDIGIEVYEERIRYFDFVPELAEMFSLDPLGLISSGCILAIASGEESAAILEFMRKKRKKTAVIGEVIARKGVYSKSGKNLAAFTSFDRDEICKL